MSTATPLLEVLVVEDSEADARLMCDTLQKNEQLHLLPVLDTCCAAVSYLQREGMYANAPCPDLILLDGHLPDEGKTLLAYVKAHPDLKHIRVVVLPL